VGGKLALRNLDGTCYQTLGSVQQFNPLAPEHDLFNQWDQESLMRGGSPLYYYEVFIQQQTVDPLYLEDRGKIFSNNPIQLWCAYEPIPSQNELSPFGIDSPDEMVFEVNYRTTLKTIGHPPKIGSRMFSPHLRENWMIVQRNLGEFKLWGALRLELVCQRFQESVTTGEGDVTQKQPDLKIKIV
jgi:hypothetical protein